MLLPCAARFGPAAEEEFREERRQAQRMAAAAAWEAEKADARVNKVAACHARTNLPVQCQHPSHSVAGAEAQCAQLLMTTAYGAGYVACVRDLCIRSSLR